MPRKSPSRKVLRSLCAEVHPDDGLDPRDDPKTPNRRGPRRKSRQLCGQVAEALSLALAGSADEALQALHVVSVEPAPDARRLLVTVGLPPAERPDPARTLDHLARASGHLRAEVAAAITRRKAPLLVYRIALPTRGERG